jgi:MFS family permease
MRPQWVALTNTTVGVLMAGVNSSIVLIALPAIFRGLAVDPLEPGNASLLLWTLMGFTVVSTVLLVTVGRFSDIFGRVRMYTAGFAVFTLGSILLALTWDSGAAGALQINIFRIIQGVGAAFLFANSPAILTDVFPPHRRGFALGSNQLAYVLGSVAGLILGGVLAEAHWRLVFVISVPFGVIGTAWAALRMRETAKLRRGEKLDPLGNLTFGVGLTLILAALNFGLLRYGTALTGWGNPWVVVALVAGTLILACFFFIETKVRDPMFRLALFRIRAFAAGNVAGWLSGIARGGLQLLLVIWLQGVWLPLHGYDFEETPLWAGIYMLPLMLGFLIGPLSGYLSDRYGARLFATLGMGLTTAGFLLLAVLPADFSYLPFALILLLLGLGMGLFSSPNTSSIMSSVPADDRGVASGMRSTLQNSGMVISMILFFSIIIFALADAMPAALAQGLRQAGLSDADIASALKLPPTAALFAAFLGYNPMEHLIPPAVLASMPSAAHAHILGREFFPGIVEGPLMRGLRLSFYISAAMSVIAGIASMLRGTHQDLRPAARPEAPPLAAVPQPEPRRS